MSLRRGGLVVGLMALGLVAFVAIGARPAPEGCLGEADLSAYEWRVDEWRNTETYVAKLDALADACASRIYVDVTGAAAVDGTESEALAGDLRKLGDEANSRGLELGAVAGDPWWPSTPNNSDVADILGFVASLQAPDGPIGAMHLDVEPWGLDGWRSDQTGLTRNYLDYVEYVEGLRADLGLAVPLAHVVPHWFDGSTDAVEPLVWAGRDATPLDHLVDIVGDEGQLVVMAYRDRAAGEGGIIDLASEEIAAGEQHLSDSSVRIGLETGRIEPASATFFGTDWQHFLSEANVVVDETGVAEIAVNDAESLIALHQSSNADD